MEITINLAHQPFIDMRPILTALRRSMAGLLAVILILGGAAYFVHQWAVKTRDRVNSLEVQIRRVSAEQQGYGAMMQQPQNLKLASQADELNQLFDAKAFSWTLIMQDLETVLPAGVQVTDIEPTRAKDGTVTVHMQVHGPRDKSVELLQNLEYSKYFRSPRIVAESADTTTAAGQKAEPVSMSSDAELDILAEYNPGSFDDPELAGAATDSRPPADAVAQLKSNPEPTPRAQSRKASLKPRAAILKGGLK